MTLRSGVAAAMLMALLFAAGCTETPHEAIGMSSLTAFATAVTIL